METKMITIPFDVEIAKKIQESKAPGKIVTLHGDAVRIVCWDMKGDSYSIVGLVTIDDREIADYYTVKGESVKNRRLSEDLKLLVPCTEENKFEPFQKVLVRDSSTGIWIASFFSYYDYNTNGKYVICDGVDYRYCIPYNEETKHLLGTTDNWEG